MRRFVRSVGCALAGIGDAFRTQRHVRIHTVFAAAVTAAGIYFGLSRLEWAILVLVMAAVITAELLNTAVETVVDLASPGLHPLAKKAKDVAAGAVLVLAVGAVVIGLLVLGPHVWDAVANRG
jgi:undecaprenol kinase